MPRRARFLLILTFAACACAQDLPVALTGTLVTPDAIVPNGTVVLRHGMIVAAGAHVTIPAGAKVVETGGIIAPGLIDLHNHLTWNVFPRWKPNTEFDTRYDWQAKPIYKVLMDAPHRALLDEGLECDAERYAEVKAITEGETSVVGGSMKHPECNRGLARNLDDDAGLGAQNPPRVIYNVFPLQMTEDEVADAKKTLAAGGSLLIHVAEGAPNSAAAAREFAQVKGRGLLAPGVSFIHAVALKPEDFAEMAAAHVGFIWSPRSNLELYGGTAQVAAAQAAGVTIALAPDWSPTGSDGLLGELQYAAEWNAGQAKPPFDDRALDAMATEQAARLVHADKVLGRIEKGDAADLLVLRDTGAAYGKDAWWTLDHARPEDVQLVMIGGQAVYGDAAPMQALTGGGALETLAICGAEKKISFASEPAQEPSFAETERRLDAGLRAAGRRLAPLAECGQ
ncbi:MAG TPA: amidohydrolase family protein [Acidobacteriaceae bacterium]|jgi:cytosine/adenosine deaminase-related metal-dependent hydrolase|nr:amidohydrolase family protein [Acidobacteriaceae bacterium]